MTNLQVLGLIIFGWLLFKTAAPFTTKLRNMREGLDGATADFVFMCIAIGFLLWAITAIFIFPY